MKSPPPMYLDTEKIDKWRRRVPKGGQINLRHTHPKARLRLRLSGGPEGAATWWTPKQKGDRQWQEAIGSYPTVSVTEAEDKAKKFHDAVRDGTYQRKNRNGRRTPIIRTLSDVLDVWVDVKRHTVTPQYARDTVNEIERTLKWSQRPLSSISEDDVRDKMDEFLEAGTRSTGIAALKTLSRLFDFAKRRRLYSGHNPLSVYKDEGWPRHAPRRRRFKSEADWATAFTIASEYPNLVMRSHYMTCAYLPNRPWGEIGGLRWDEVDFAAKTLTIAGERLKVKTADRVAKNREPDLVIPMTTQVERILQNLKAVTPFERLNEKARPFVFYSQRSRTGYISQSGNGTLMKAIRNVLEPEIKSAKESSIETYSLKRYWVTVAEQMKDVPIKHRYYLGDHQLRIGEQDDTYAAPLDVEKVRDSAQKVADKLESLLALAK